MECEVFTGAVIMGFSSEGNVCLVCLCAIRQQVAESAHHLSTRIEREAGGGCKLQTCSEGDVEGGAHEKVSLNFTQRSKQDENVT